MQDEPLFRLARSLRERGYRFVTTTPATHARVNARPQNARATSLEDVFGWSRPFGPGTVPPDLLDAMREAGVLRADGGDTRAGVRASTLHGQLFLHSAWPTVENDAVFFGPDSYRFADAISRHLAEGARVTRAVDVGCGAGPGAVVIALRRPGADVLAIDINDRALALTAVNAALAGARNVAAHRSNLLSDVRGEFDLVVANPPYLLDPQERTYRHGGGRHGEGLSVAIVRQALGRLAPDGTLLLYTGTAIRHGRDAFQAAVMPIVDVPGIDWRYDEVDPDVFGEELQEPAYADVDRIAAVLLTARRRPG